jgi:hypothetical protein
MLLDPSSEAVKSVSMYLSLARVYAVSLAHAPTLVPLVTNHCLDLPTRDDMRSLQRTFPAFATWCKSHKILKASTCKTPCIPWRIGAPGYADDDPYYRVYNPWDFENESENAEV